MDSGKSSFYEQGLSLIFTLQSTSKGFLSSEDTVPLEPLAVLKPCLGCPCSVLSIGVAFGFCKSGGPFRGEQVGSFLRGGGNNPGVYPTLTEKMTDNGVALCREPLCGFFDAALCMGRIGPGPQRAKKIDLCIADTFHKPKHSLSREAFTNPKTQREQGKTFWMWSVLNRVERGALRMGHSFGQLSGISGNG